MKNRKRLALWSALLLVAVAGIHLYSALALDTQLQYTQLTYASEKVTAELEGYTLVFLTDIHSCPPEMLLQMVEQINSRGVDLVLMGGDFWGQESLADCLQVLSEIKAADGFYGVSGNHDRSDELAAAMAAAGMTLLCNRGASVGEGLFVAGVEDLWMGRPDVKAAAADAAQGDLVLLLSHNPDVSMQQDLGAVDLTLSGHTHGGQITFFGVWAPAVSLISDYGQRFVSGWCQSAAGTDVYVSRGVWQVDREPWWMSIRVFARPEVVYVTLVQNHKEPAVGTSVFGAYRGFFMIRSRFPQHLSARSSPCLKLL